jgi:heme a synthase
MGCTAVDRGCALAYVEAPRDGGAVSQDPRDARRARIGAPSPPPSTPPSGSQRLGRGFAALVAGVFVLIVLGALVRAHGAGLACPDWPLCFGEVVPRLDAKVAFEYGHRVVAGSVAIAFAALAVLALRDRESRRSVGPLLAVAALLLGLQILLGALTVWKLLASWSVTSHLLVGNAFAAVLLLVALRLLHGEARAPGERSAAARVALSATGALLVLQLALGGLVASSYAGLVCPEWPACRDGVWLPHFGGAMGFQLAHRLNAYVLVAALAGAAALSGRVPALRRRALIALAILVAQVGVGALNVLWRLPVEITGLHSALAASLVLVLTATLREAWARPAAG